MYSVKNKIMLLKKCKNLSESSECISYEFMKKFSCFLLILWFISPLFLLFINYFVDMYFISYIWLTFLYIISTGCIINSVLFFLKYKIKNIKFTITFFVIYLLWAFISCFFANNKLFAFFGEAYFNEGFFTYVCYFFMFISSIILDNERKSKVFKIFSIVSFIMSIIVLIGYYFKIDFNFYRTFTSIFFNENHSAYYFMMGYMCTILLFIFNKGKKYISYLIMSLVILHNLVLNNTLGCYVSVIFTLFILLIYCFIIRNNLKKLSVVIISFILVSVIGSDLVKVNFKQLSGDVINIKNNIGVIASESNDITVQETKKILYKTGTNRLGLWLYGLEFIREKPIFGYGIENLYEQYSKTDVTHVTRRPHNEYIQIGAFMGIPALIFYLCFLGSIYFKIIFSIKKIDKYIIISAFIAFSYLVSAFFGLSMFYTTPYLFIFLGFTASYYIEEKN